jgi:hypothetical protein
MFEKWTKHVSRMDLRFIAYELTRRIRRKRPIDPLNPVPQTKALDFPADLVKVIDEIQAFIEAQYEVPIDQIDEETERQLVREFDDLAYERLKASPDYDPEQVKRAVEAINNTPLYHKNLRRTPIRLVDED